MLVQSSRASWASIQKDSAKGTAAGNYRPISCLPLMWKILTGIFAEVIYDHLISANDYGEFERSFNPGRPGGGHFDPKFFICPNSFFRGLFLWPCFLVAEFLPFFDHLVHLPCLNSNFYGYGCLHRLTHWRYWPFLKKMKIARKHPQKTSYLHFLAYLVANTPLSLVSCIRPKITNFFQKNIEKTGFSWKSDILQNSVKSTWGRLVKMKHCELIIEVFIVPIAKTTFRRILNRFNPFRSITFL